ncbi:hypothetical protein Tco_1191564 [Tanacetum coccineum]
MTSTYKIKFHLLFEESTRSVLLPTGINYKGLVSYCKKKFGIKEVDDICLSYEDNSERIDISDNEDLQCCLTTFGFVYGNACVPKIFITLTKTCKAYTVPEFEKSISGIKALRPKAYRKLEAAGFEKWSRAVGSMIIHTNLNNDVQNQDAGK